MLRCERQEMHKNIDAENSFVNSHLEDWETDGGYVAEGTGSGSCPVADFDNEWTTREFIS
jgi:hypothetical protein